MLTYRSEEFEVWDCATASPTKTSASCWALVDKNATSCGFIDTSTSCTSKLDVAYSVTSKIKL